MRCAGDVDSLGVSCGIMVHGMQMSVVAVLPR
jgi:hypothetical protein